MINLFNLGRTAVAVTPSELKEKAYESLQNNEIFNNVKNSTIGKTIQKGKKYIEEQKIKSKKSKLFADEMRAYEKMKTDGIDDNEAFSLIKQRREMMIKHFGVENKLTQKENESIAKMRSDGLTSIDALQGLQEYRKNFGSRDEQLKVEQKQTQQKKWDEHYNNMPWYKKAGYHTMQGAIGMFEGGMNVGVNTVDFLAGGTKTGQDWREAVAEMNEDPMFNSWSRSAGKFLGESAVMGGSAYLGGGALAGTKIGSTLGARAMMTPATSWGGMAVQGAVAGAGYGAWDNVAQNGSEATAKSIGQQAMIGGALGGVATPLLGKVVLPAVGNAIGGGAKIGNAGVQAFKHTTGTLDDKVASAVDAIRKSTGRSITHTGKNIVNTAVSAKENLMRKFLQNNSDDIVQKGGIQKIKQMRNNIAGLDKRDIQILKNTTTEEFDEWMQYAKNAMDDNYAQTPYHKGAKKANEAMDMLEENLRNNQIKRMQIVENSNIKTINLNDVRPKIMDDLKKTFNIEGWKYGKKGEVIPTIAKGRKSLLDIGNTRDMQALKMLDDALKGGSPAEVMDTIKILQNHVYDSSTGLRVSDSMKKFLERTTGKMNHTFKTTMGDDYARILSEMSDDIKLEKEIQRIFKPSDIDGVTNRGELAMKRLSNGTTTSGEVRDLALKIQQRTGIDLIKESRLAQMSMDIVGDERGATLFGLIKDGKGGAVKYLLDKGRNVVANKEAVARANTIKNILGITKDAKIQGLDNVILSTKFSKNDTKIIAQIAKNIKENKPLTPTQTKNLITIKELIEKKIPKEEVENFKKLLPNKDIGIGLSSIAKRQEVVNMANARTNFYKNFRKISEKQFKKLQDAVKNNQFLGIKSIPSERLLKDLQNLGIKQKITAQRISSNGIKHILKGHGVQSGDKIPVTMEDIKIIPEIQQNYDKIYKSKYENNNHQDVIIYEKKIGNYYYYLERITEKGMLDTQTMYIREQKRNLK